MDFPSNPKNSQVETQPLAVNAPAFSTSGTSEERWIAQQWRDVVNNGTHEAHPLSLNRDAAQVTTDPYDA